MQIARNVGKLLNSPPKDSNAMERLNLSARAYYRIFESEQNYCNLAGSDDIKRNTLQSLQHFTNCT